jgi:hypothetical protein
MNDQAKRFLPTVQLPGNAVDFAAQYKLKRATTLLDAVESCVRVLMDNAQFRAFVNEVNDEDAIEGSLHYDDVAAAQMIRDYAKDNGAPASVANAKMKTLVHAMNAALRRFGASRKQRRVEA